jgi:hypothetical protein
MIYAVSLTSAEMVSGGVIDAGDMISAVSLILHKFIVYRISWQTRSHTLNGSNSLVWGLGGFD